MFLVSGYIVQVMTNLNTTRTRYVNWQEILLTGITIKHIIIQKKLHHVSLLLLLETSCRGEVDGVVLRLLGFLPDAAAGKLLGHRVPELGVGHSVDQRVQTAR